MKTNHAHLVAACCSALLLSALPVFAQETPRGDDAIAPPPAVAAVADDVKPVSEHSFGISTGVNIGLIQVDAQYGHFYGFASTTLGVPLVSNGADAVGALGLGYTVALSSPSESMWYFDMYALGMGGKLTSYAPSGSSYGALGVGVGLRYLHRSGFTMGFKLPLFGASFGDSVNLNGSFNGATSLSNFYFGYLMSSAPLTLGFRF
jgi:hypothetical protein